ncbi:MAG: hypothetical protein ABWY81_06115 [Jiangellaceae bacterium]
MNRKVIRIWDGCTVVMVIDVDQTGGSVSRDAVGGAGNSSNPDIEIDPWAGLIVDHSIERSPVDFREVEP